MREIQRRLAAEAWLQRASRRLAESLLFRTSDPWLNCCLQTKALIDNGLRGILAITPRKRPSVYQFSLTQTSGLHEIYLAEKAGYSETDSPLDHIFGLWMQADPLPVSPPLRILTVPVLAPARQWLCL